MNALFILGMGQAIGRILTFVGILFFIWNLLICFFGYKLFRIQLAVMGFLFGSSAGVLLGLALFQSIFTARLLALILGVLAAWLAYKLYLAGVFIAVFFSSFTLLTLLFTFMTRSFHPTIVILPILISIALAVVCVIFHRSILIVYTALSGGLSTGMTLALVLMSPSAGVVFGIILSALGAWVQFKLERNKALEGLFRPGEGAAAYSSLVSSLMDSFMKPKKDIASMVNGKKRRGENRNPNQTLLFCNKGSYWTKNMPMLVTEIQIAGQDAEEETAFLNLAVQNLGTQPILEISLDATCCDGEGNQLEGLHNAVFQDMNLEKGDDWFSSKSIPLPDPAARSCVVTVNSVTLAEGQVWKNQSNDPLFQLPPQADLTLSPELTREFYTEIEEHLNVRNAAGLYRFSPQQEDEYWRCSCGQHNISDTCASCGLERDFLFSIFDDSKLQQQARQRDAEKLRLEEERKKRMEEQKEAVRQKSGQAAERIRQTVRSATEKVRPSLLPLINRAKEHKKASILTGGCACILIIVLITGLSIYNSDYHRFFRALQKEDYSQAREIYQSAKGNGLEKIQNEILDKAKSIENQFKNRDITFKEADSSLNQLLESTSGFMGLFGKDSTSSKLSNIQYNMERLNDSRKAFDEGKKKLAEKDYSDAVVCFSSVIEEDENYSQAQADLKKAMENQAFLAMKNKLTALVESCGPLQSQTPRTAQINQGKKDVLNASLMTTEDGGYGLLVTVYDTRYFSPAPSTTLYTWTNGRLNAAWSDAFTGWYPLESLSTAQDSHGNSILLNEVKGSDMDFLKQRNDYIQFHPDGDYDTAAFEQLGDPTGATYTVDGSSVSKEDWDMEQKAYTDLKWTPIVSTDQQNPGKFTVYVNSEKSVGDTLARLDNLMK